MRSESFWAVLAGTVVTGVKVLLPGLYGCKLIFILQPYFRVYAVKNIFFLYLNRIRSIYYGYKSIFIIRTVMNLLYYGLKKKFPFMAVFGPAAWALPKGPFKIR